MQQIQEREKSSIGQVSSSRFAIVRISEEELNGDETRFSGSGRNDERRLTGPGMMNDRRLSGRVNFGSNFEEIQI